MTDSEGGGHEVSDMRTRTLVQELRMTDVGGKSIGASLKPSKPRPSSMILRSWSNWKASS
jgi:hypothetical protein